LDEDRRCNGRTKFLKHVRVERLDSPHSEQLGTMINLSRDGLYFTVHAADYKVGWQLRVTLLEAKSDWQCEVVRTERLPNGRLGVGVRFLDW
jgi:hypothetical protein